MPISAQMTLWGMMEYDPTILDGLTVPTGMDASTVKDNLLMETASMEILYPSVPFLKAAITAWSAERHDVWQKLYDTTQLDYNPIENYDRLEETNRAASGLTNTDSSLSGSTTGKSKKANSATSQQTGETTATNSNTAYNSATFADTARSVSSGNNQNVSSDVSNDETETTSSDHQTGRSDSSSNELVRSRIHGNIGVTTSQQMIEAQRDVVQFCMTEYIINDFITRFCVGVY